MTIGFSEDAISTWYYKNEKQRKRGRQKVYSDLAIETAYTLRLGYKKPLRDTKGFMQSIVQLLELHLSVL
ncbi:MAG: transposase [Alphaproteobacteria bacterium]|nr:transposase [Alphaproteobacteria bacterium]